MGFHGAIMLRYIGIMSWRVVINGELQIVLHGLSMIYENTACWRTYPATSTVLLLSVPCGHSYGALMRHSCLPDGNQNDAKMTVSSEMDSIGPLPGSSYENRVVFENWHNEPFSTIESRWEFKL